MSKSLVKPDALTHNLDMDTSRPANLLSVRTAIVVTLLLLALATLSYRYPREDSGESSPAETRNLFLLHLFNKGNNGGGQQQQQGSFCDVGTLTHLDSRSTEQRSFELLETLNHDNSAFTQGLVLVESGDNTTTLFEGTGLNGRSSIRIVDLPTGNVLKQTDLADEYFGEGVTYYKDDKGNERLVQLTWKKRTAFVYNMDLDRLGSFQFSSTNNEGWGITLRGTPGASSPEGRIANPHFIQSDGSSNLHKWDLTGAEVCKRVAVFEKTSTHNRLPVSRLNELEWDPVTDTVLANVWQSDRIVRIDPRTGLVVTNYNMSSLYPDRPPGTNVLNGIAKVSGTTDEWWVTGKLWPKIFRVRLG